MSDVSVLSHEYQTASQLSQSINDAVITLKKALMHLPGGETIGKAELSKSGAYLAKTLEALVSLLAPSTAWDTTSFDVARIPSSLVARLQRERRGDLPYYVDDLRGLAHRLRIEPLELNTKELAALDQLASAADGEAARVFRRLMRT